MFLMEYLYAICSYLKFPESSRIRKDVQAVREIGKI